MEEPLGKTESVCPECLLKIPAKRVTWGGSVYLEKKCPFHGEYKTLIWQDDQHYLEWNRKRDDGLVPQKRLTPQERGCPYDCGICPQHEQNSCTVLMEVTHRCNLRCPICYSSSPQKDYPEPDLSTIEEMYTTAMDSGGPYPIQLTGGEPTLRDDLPQIIALGKEKGFSHIQIDTNGLRIAEDMEYLWKLKESGASVIFLQFDGLSEEVYRYVRGANLLKLKIQTIRNCAQVRIGVILVVTLIPGINDRQLGKIIQFAKEWIPVVKGVHIQPISYFGRYPAKPEDGGRITIPEILKAIEDQTYGELKEENFVPPG